MSDYRVMHVAALADHRPVVRNGVTLEAPDEGTVLHLLSRAQTDGIAAAVPSVPGLQLRFVSVGQWFAVGNSKLTNGELETIAARLRPAVDVVDQSHGRVRILVRGPHAATVLAKGTAVDLAPSSLTVGHSATTLIGHIAVHVTRIDDGFELLVLRGFAESLWDDLVRMSLEFT
jgi:sarcosine oxidase subunit gamma